MTEKRFIEIVSVEKVIDTQTGKEYKCIIDDDLLELLNELHEENIEIKCKSQMVYERDAYKKLYDELKQENERLTRQIGNLKHTRDFCDEVCADCERLEKENEQLKFQLNNCLHRKLFSRRELERENEQLKQYKDAVLNCDSSKIIRVNRNTGEVDLIGKEYSDESYR